MPVVGFFIFFLVGSRISNKKIFRLRTQEQRGLEQIADNQRQQLQKIEQLLPVPDAASELVNLFLSSDEAVLTRGNDIKVYNNIAYNIFTQNNPNEMWKNYLDSKIGTIWDKADSSAFGLRK